MGSHVTRPAGTEACSLSSHLEIVGLFLLKGSPSKIPPLLATVNSACYSQSVPVKNTSFPPVISDGCSCSSRGFAAAATANANVLRIRIITTVGNARHPRHIAAVKVIDSAIKTCLLSVTSKCFPSLTDTFFFFFDQLSLFS